MSSVYCPPSPTYNTSVQQKIQSRQSAKKYQFGSPQLRNLLREKCRIRVREARHAKFDGSRSVGEPGGNALLSKILRQELADLETDLNLQEKIYTELLDEVNTWFVEEMEEEENYLINVGDNEVVFCPVCQKEELKQTIDRQIICKCGVSFNFSETLETLAATLTKTFAQHELNCPQKLNFFVEQNGNLKILNAMCESCDYFKSLT